MTHGLCVRMNVCVTYRLTRIFYPQTNLRTMRELHKKPIEFVAEKQKNVRQTLHQNARPNAFRRNDFALHKPFWYFSEFFPT